MPTKRELIQVRQTTYKPPPDGKRCETCEHWWDSGHNDGNCRAIMVRDAVVWFVVHAFGVCDLWEAKR